jgi:methylated-DNA-[protein]-cysteine S-methyltransferase
MVAIDLQEKPAKSFADKAFPDKSIPDKSFAGERYWLFDTAIGPCALAWSDRGVTRMRLPESDRGATERRIARRRIQACAARPVEIDRLIVAIQDHMNGRGTDYLGVALDLTGIGAFEQDVYTAARHIPWGRTTTYGELARQIGTPDGARAVGRALGRNPIPIIVPCHRILAKGGVGGFSAPGGIFTKQSLLALEGVQVDAGTPLFPGFV